MHFALVHLRHAASGGTERYLNHLAAHLAERGHRVDVLCRRHEDPPHPGVNLVRLTGPALTPAGRLLRFDRDVARHLARSTYDAVYGLGRTTCHDLVRLGGGCQETYLESAHGASLGPLERWLGLGRSKQRANVAMEARGLAPSAYQQVVVNSRLVAKDVQRRYGVLDAQLKVLHNGVDLRRFHPSRRAEEGAKERSARGLGPRDRVLLFLGNGYGRKGLDLVLELWPKLAAARPRWRLWVVGQDSRAPEFHARARARGGDERLSLLGPTQSPERFFAAADLYLLPTRYDPFANSTLEALASGVPVLTSDRNGGGEVLWTDRWGRGPAGWVLPAPSDQIDRPTTDAWGEALLHWTAEPEGGGADLDAARQAAREAALAHPIEEKLERSARWLESIGEANRGHPPAERFAPRLSELGL